MGLSFLILIFLERGNGWDGFGGKREGNGGMRTSEVAKGEGSSAQQRSLLKHRKPRRSPETRTWDPSQRREGGSVNTNTGEAKINRHGQSCQGGGQGPAEDLHLELG